MDPPRVSSPSSPPRPAAVKRDPGPGPAAPNYRQLLRQILAAEKALRDYRPSAREGPREPRNADEVLAALASRYRPGDAVGLVQVIECIAVTWEHARAVRAWAQHNGAWPYVRPSPCRPAGTRPKGGDS